MIYIVVSVKNNFYIFFVSTFRFELFSLHIIPDRSVPNMHRCLQAILEISQMKGGFLPILHFSKF